MLHSRRESILQTGSTWGSNWEDKTRLIITKFGCAKFHVKSIFLSGSTKEGGGHYKRLLFVDSLVF